MFFSNPKNMLVTTTSTLQGCSIVEYKGIVFGEVVYGMNFVKDFFAGITDKIGGRCSSYEDGMASARDDAIAEMCERAQAMGANAVIGVDIDYDVLGEKNGMLMISVSGTAVIIDK